MLWWAQLVWCGLLLLLRFPPRWLGLRGAVVITALIGVPLRLWAILASIMVLGVIGIGRIFVAAFYILTALWIVLFVLLYARRCSAAGRLAWWMTGIAAIEGYAALNTAAGAVIAAFSVGFSRSLARTTIALFYTVLQVVCLHAFSKTSGQKHDTSETDSAP